MLKCNLAVLLAERRLRITKVSKDTGISRTTLTSLANNNSQGIQFDTLNTLCSYLNIKPADFFCYVPFEFSVEVTHQQLDIFDVIVTFVNLQGKELAKNKFEAGVEADDPLIITIEKTSDNLEHDFFSSQFKTLPIMIRREIDDQIGRKIQSFYDLQVPFSIFWSIF